MRGVGGALWNPTNNSSVYHNDRCQNNRANSRTGLHTNKSATPRLGSNGRASRRLPYLTVAAPTKVPASSLPAKTVLLSNPCAAPLLCSPFELCVLQSLSLRPAMPWEADVLGPARARLRPPEHANMLLHVHYAPIKSTNRMRTPHKDERAGRWHVLG